MRGEKRLTLLSDVKQGTSYILLLTYSAAVDENGEDDIT